MTFSLKSTYFNVSSHFSFLKLCIYIFCLDEKCYLFTFQKITERDAFVIV